MSDTPVTATTVSTPSADVMNPKWLAAILPLAKRLGMEPTVVTEKILAAKLVGTPDDSGAETVVDSDAVSDSDLIAAFPDAPKGTLKKGIKEMREVASPKQVPVAPTAPTPQRTFVDLLAPVPGDGKSMLVGLSLVQVGKIDRETVAAGVRAAIADRAGLFKVAGVLLEMMDEFVTKRAEEPAGQTYYDLEELIASENNADVLKLLKVDSRFVSKARKQEFLGRIGVLWEPARGFQQQLKSWYDSYLAVVGNPAMLMQGIAALASGAPMMGPGMMTAPETTQLHDGAQLVIQAINRAFAGRAIPAALALHFDAERINGFLTNPEVVRYTGCTNREELARLLAQKLGTGAIVTPDYQRLEQVLVQFVLSVYEIDSRAPAGTPQELQYIAALYQLGQTIPWDKLFESGGKLRNGHADPTPIGGRTRRNPNDPFPMDP